MTTITNPELHIVEYIDDAGRKQTGDRAMTQVVAINQERTRKAWSDEPHDKISVIWTAENERIEVDEMAYWKLREQADPVVDYHDGDYIGFDRPIEWDDVLPARNPY